MRNFFNMDNPLFRTLGKLADLMILNIVFIICCLPIFTIGAALTGLSYVTLKMAENEEGYIVKGFFKSFRQNFRQATIMWLIMLLLGVVLGLDFFILGQATGSLVSVFRVGVTVAAFFYMMVMVYLFAVLARFDNPVRATMKNALIMSIADFPRTIIMIAITVGAVVVTFLNTYTIVYGILVWIMAGFALVSYANCFFIRKVFAKYMPKDEGQEKDPDAWYVEENEKDNAEETSSADKVLTDSTDAPQEAPAETASAE